MEKYIHKLQVKVVTIDFTPSAVYNTLFELQQVKAAHVDLVCAFSPATYHIYKVIF